MVKVSVRKYSMASMEVSIPTSAIIPKAMIRTVRIVLTKCDFMDSKDILIFSTNNPAIVIRIMKHNKDKYYYSTYIKFIIETSKLLQMCA